MKLRGNMHEFTRIAASGFLIFAAWHILDVLKAAIRAKYENVEPLIALAGVCIFAVAYVARGGFNKEDKE